MRQNLKDTINGKAEFQSTHPSGVRPPTPRWSPAFSAISIHAPQWGATVQWALTYSTCWIFQSTHPSGVRPFPDYFAAHCGLISIHAPQWGATLPPQLVTVTDLFQSTHPSGVRLSSRNRSSHVWDFNPRTPVGCDSRLQAAGTACTFQSTHPSGVRLHVRCEFVNLRVFQSTHPSGVRRTSAYTVDLLDDISIHAPQWGATRHLWYSGNGRNISIHAPQWGATVAGRNDQTCERDFNPRTPVGCD